MSNERSTKTKKPQLIDWLNSLRVHNRPTNNYFWFVSSVAPKRRSKHPGLTARLAKLYGVN